MNRKRWLLAIAALAVLACLVCLILGLIPSGPGLTRANFDRIEVGMKLVEVEELFGKPAHPAPRGKEGAKGVRTLLWLDEDGSIAAAIRFDDEWRVEAKGWRDDSLMTQIRRLIPWLP